VAGKEPFIQMHSTIPIARRQNHTQFFGIISLFDEGGDLGHLTRQIIYLNNCDYKLPKQRPLVSNIAR
jgi:hypothetical protein